MDKIKFESVEKAERYFEQMNSLRSKYSRTTYERIGKKVIRY